MRLANSVRRTQSGDRKETAPPVAKVEKAHQENSQLLVSGKTHHESFIVSQLVNLRHNDFASKLKKCIEQSLDLDRCFFSKSLPKGCLPPFP